MTVSDAVFAANVDAKGCKARGQSLHYCGARRSDQLRLHPCRVHRRIAQQFYRSGGRHRKRAVCAFYRSAANIERGADDLVHLQGLRSHRRANYVDHGIHGTHFVELHLLDGRGVNFCLSRPERLKDRDRCLLGRIADRRLTDDLANLRQPAAVRVLIWRGRPRPRIVGPGRAQVVMMILVVMIVMMTVLAFMLLLLRPVHFTRHVLLAIDPNVNLRCRNAATYNTGDLQVRAYVQRRHGIFEYLRRNSGVDQRAQEHVSADSGKALKIRNPHKSSPKRHRDHEGNSHKTMISVSSASSVVKLSSAATRNLHHREALNLRQTCAASAL